LNKLELSSGKKIKSKKMLESQRKPKAIPKGVMSHKTSIFPELDSSKITYDTFRSNERNRMTSVDYDIDLT